MNSQYQSDSFVEDVLSGLISKDIDASGTFTPRLISNQFGNTMIDALSEEISTSDSFDMSVAFIREEAMRALLQPFFTHAQQSHDNQQTLDSQQTSSNSAPADRGNTSPDDNTSLNDDNTLLVNSSASAPTGRIITSTKNYFNTPNVFRELLKLKKTANIDVRIWSKAAAHSQHESSALSPSQAKASKPTAQGENFHPKGYIFAHHTKQQNNASGNPNNSTNAHENSIDSNNSYYNIYIGSSNLTVAALQSQREWNLKVSSRNDGDLINQIHTELDSQIQSSIPLTEEWIQQYEEDFKRFAPPRKQLVQEYEQSQRKIEPNPMQREALRNLQALRDKGEHRAIVISATGTGKTYLSAFDVQQARPKRMLYIAHQQQILEKAKQSYMKILHCDEEDCGIFSGTSKDFDRKYVFATIQTLSQPHVLQQFNSDEFDYILVDESHHVGAESYQRVIEHFVDAKFMLGMTATPERTDGINIFSLFGYNIAYEIRLQRALEQNMLCPFHYYGIAEYLGSKEEIKYTVKQLTSPERVRYIIDKLEQYSPAYQPVTGLVFCSDVEESDTLSALFNTFVNQQAETRNFRTKSITGKTPIAQREQAIRELESGKLDYIFTVDLFNEGIDIPAVNQIVMLRNTQSSIIFTQQLGRGLRKFPSKESVTVLDFIGNYTNNFLIPVALYGNTGDRDIARKNMQQHTLELSSISFDPIAKERVLASLDKADWSEMQKLSDQYRQLRFQLGRVPMLTDIFNFDESLPLTIALKKSNYLEFVQSREKSIHEELVHEQFSREQIMAPLSAQESGMLNLVTQHLLAGLRPHELVILDMLLNNMQSHPAGLALEDVSREIQYRYPIAVVDDKHISSALHVLDLSFFLDGTQKRYANAPLIALQHTEYGTVIQPSQELQAALQDDVFKHFLIDTVQTALRNYELLVQDAERIQRNFERDFLYEHKYRLVDVFRLLCVDKEPNAQNVGGYAQPGNNDFMPIFVKYASSQYEDTFVGPQDLFWYSKNKRTAQSPEFRWMARHDELEPWSDTHFVPLFVMRKAEAKEARYYYVGHVSAVTGVKETTKPAGDDGEKREKVVTANLHLEQPIDMELFRHITDR